MGKVIDASQRISFFERIFYSFLFSYFAVAANVIFMGNLNIGIGDMYTLTYAIIYYFLFSLLFCGLAIKRTSGLSGYLSGIILSFSAAVIPCALGSMYYLLIGQYGSALILPVALGLAIVPPLIISASLTSLITKIFGNHLMG